MVLIILVAHVGDILEMVLIIISGLCGGDPGNGVNH